MVNINTHLEKNKQNESLIDSISEKLEQTQKKIKKNRCSFWPNCKSNNCIYFHPKEACKTYPNCLNDGETCLFIHPTCDNGSNCKEKNCKMYHPKNPPPIKQQNKPRKSETLQVHLSNPGTRTVTLNSSFSTPNFEIMSNCKFGYGCKRVGCKFEHPEDACPKGKNCLDPDCSLSHTAPCKKGSSCSKPGCSYSHKPQKM